MEILQAKEAKNSDKLEKLLSHKDQYFEIKYAILENYYLSKKAFSIIINNALERQNSIRILQDARFDSAFDKYPDITNKFLRAIFRKKDNNSRWRIFLAKCPYTPLDILDRLSQSTNISVLCNLAENKSTSENILLKLSRKNDHDINHSLRKNSQLPKVIKKSLAVEKITTWELAFGDSVSDLKQIALSSDDPRILRHVVLNPSTNTEVLEILAKDIDIEVRSCVAMDCKTPLNIIEELAKDENEEVRHSVLRNPNLTKEIFYRLMPDIYGRCDYSLGRLLAFLDPSVSPGILEQNASSLLWNERFAIAVHPTTPEETVKKLILDGNIYVRTVASERLSSN